MLPTSSAGGQTLLFVVVNMIFILAAATNANLCHHDGFLSLSAV